MPKDMSVASVKYDFANEENIELSGEFILDDERNRSKFKVDNRRFYLRAKETTEGRRSGKIVFTGQNSKRVEADKKNGKKASGKANEFIFFDEEKFTCNLEKSDRCIADFFTMYKYSPDFKDYWSKKLDKGEKIPIFFTVKAAARQEIAKGIHDNLRGQVVGEFATQRSGESSGSSILSSGELHHIVDKKNNEKWEIFNIGLSYLFKYPYENSVWSAIGTEHKDIHKPDLAELVFGSIDFNVKGRVRFSHASLKTMGDGYSNTNATKTVVLASPRASYYPIYLKSGKTWKDTSPIIKGRKKYLIRSTPLPTSGNGNAKTETTFAPLPSGTVFETKIYFHNLNEIELGALLSALTFHGNGNLFHSIGAIKSYGYGKVSLKIEKIDRFDIDNIKDIPRSIWLGYLSSFEDAMNNSSVIEYAWRDSLQIKNLYSMASGIPDDKTEKFEYMKMNLDQNDGGPNEFVLAKENGEYLPYYADIVGDDNAICLEDLDGIIKEVEFEEKEQERIIIKKRASEEQAEREQKLLEEEERKASEDAQRVGSKYHEGDAVKIKITSNQKPKEGFVVCNGEPDVKVQIVGNIANAINLGDIIDGTVVQKSGKDGRITQVKLGIIKNSVVQNNPSVPVVKKVQNQFESKSYKDINAAFMRYKTLKLEDDKALLLEVASGTINIVGNSENQRKDLLRKIKKLNLV